MWSGRGQFGWSQAGVIRGLDFFSGGGGISPSKSGESEEGPWDGDGVEFVWARVIRMFWLLGFREDEGSWAMGRS